MPSTPSAVEIGARPRVDPARLALAEQRVVLPAADADHDVARSEPLEVRAHDLADRAAGHDLADRHGSRVGRRLAHPAAHVGVEREIDRAAQHLARAGLRDRRLLEAEILRPRLALRARGQHDPAVDLAHGLPPPRTHPGHHGASSNRRRQARARCCMLMPRGAHRATGLRPVRRTWMPCRAGARATTGPERASSSDGFRDQLGRLRQPVHHRGDARRVRRRGAPAAHARRRGGARPRPGQARADPGRGRGRDRRQGRPRALRSRRDRRRHRACRLSGHRAGRGARRGLRGRCRPLRPLGRDHPGHRRYRAHAADPGRFRPDRRGSRRDRRRAGRPRAAPSRHADGRAHPSAARAADHLRLQMRGLARRGPAPAGKARPPARGGPGGPARRRGRHARRARRRRHRGAGSARRGARPARAGGRLARRPRRPRRGRRPSSAC